jgi:hypothetical protein
VWRVFAKKRQQGSRGGAGYVFGRLVSPTWAGEWGEGVGGAGCP